MKSVAKNRRQCQLFSVQPVLVENFVFYMSLCCPVSICHVLLFVGADEAFCERSVDQIDCLFSRGG